MKKLLAILLVIMLALPCISVTAWAEGENEVYHGSDYAGAMTGHWDSMLVDGVEIGAGTQIQTYIVSSNFRIEEQANTLCVRGWAVCDSEVRSFGYQINNDAPVFKDEFSVETEQAIYDAGTSIGAEYGGRFVVDIDVSELKGKNSIAVLLDTEDGIYTVSLMVGFDLEFDFIQKGTESEPTPTPETMETAEPVIVRFNTVEEVDDFFLFSNYNSNVTSIDFDEEKKCAVIETSAGLDPNVKLPFGQIADDDTYDMESIDTSVYKALLLVGRFDYDTILNSDQDVIGSFYFTTDADNTLTESKNLIYTYERTDGLQFVVLDFSENRFWKGSVDDCRFDYFAKTDNDCTYDFYLLGFFSDANEANAFAESYKEIGDAIFPTPEPTPTPTETPEVTAAPEDTTTKEPDAVIPTETADGKETSDKPAKKAGCGGFVAAIPALALAVSAAVILRKKKR